MNTTNPLETLPGKETLAPTSKRKTAVRRVAASGAKTSITRRKVAPAPAEILFKDLPNPFQTPIPPYIWIDHPQDGERLQGPVYVIRLGVGGADAVELSVDKGPWAECRLTSGYWWYDWEGIAPGKHTLVARMRAPDGRWFRTPPCRLEYKP